MPETPASEVVHLAHGLRPNLNLEMKVRPSRYITLSVSPRPGPSNPPTPTRKSAFSIYFPRARYHALPATHLSTFAGVSIGVIRRFFFLFRSRVDLVAVQGDTFDGAKPYLPITSSLHQPSTP